MYNVNKKFFKNNGHTLIFLFSYWLKSIFELWQGLMPKVSKIGVKDLIRVKKFRRIKNWSNLSDRIEFL